MKNFKYFLILFTFFLSACSLSVDDLTKQVKQNMQDELKQKNISITSLVLTKKGGNEYSGILKTLEPNGNFTYTVEVIYDGKSFTWKITE
jgi:hypothetical protein